MASHRRRVSGNGSLLWILLPFVLGASLAGCDTVAGLLFPAPPAPSPEELARRAEYVRLTTLVHEKYLEALRELVIQNQALLAIGTAAQNVPLEGPVDPSVRLDIDRATLVALESGLLSMRASTEAIEAQSALRALSAGRSKLERQELAPAVVAVGKLAVVAYTAMETWRALEEGVLRQSNRTGRTVIETAPEADLPLIRRDLMLPSDASRSQMLAHYDSAPIRARQTLSWILTNTAKLSDDPQFRLNIIRTEGKNVVGAGLAGVAQGFKTVISVGSKRLGIDPDGWINTFIEAKVGAAWDFLQPLIAVGAEALGIDTSLSGNFITFISKNRSTGNAVAAPSQAMSDNQAKTLIESASENIDSVAPNDLFDAVSHQMRRFALDPANGLDARVNEDGSIDVPLPRQMHLLELPDQLEQLMEVQIPNIDHLMDQVSAEIFLNGAQLQEIAELDLTGDKPVIAVDSAPASNGPPDVVVPTGACCIDVLGEPVCVTFREGNCNSWPGVYAGDGTKCGSDQRCINATDIGTDGSSNDPDSCAGPCPCDASQFVRINGFWVFCDSGEAHLKMSISNLSDRPIFVSRWASRNVTSVFGFQGGLDPGETEGAMDVNPGGAEPPFESFPCTSFITAEWLDGKCPECTNFECLQEIPIPVQEPRDCEYNKPRCGS